MMMKLKHTEKAEYREMLLQKQGGVCALCENVINEGQATLDHDHGSGHCRMVLCRNCNSIEGRILHWAKRTGSPIEAWLTNLMWYWNQDWTDNPVYPTHKTYIEKEIAKLRKIKKKVKLHKTKAKYEAKIQRLLKQLKKEDRSEKNSHQELKARCNNSRPKTRTKRTRNKKSL